MAFNVSNFVIDRPLRGIAFKTGTYDIMWAVNQLTDCSLSCSSETSEAVDAIGSTIMTFERSKSAQFTATNAIFDLDLLAASMGTEKELASDANPIVTPCFDTITVKSGVNVYDLKHTPLENVTQIYALNGDDTVGTVYKAATNASATEFVYSGGKITVPTGSAAGMQYIVIYDYEAKQAVSVTNSATQFPKSMKFVLEVLGADVCDPTTLIYAYVIFPNAKLSSTVDIGLATDSGMPITIDCAQAYCDKEKKLFQIIVPDPEEE